MIFEDTYEVRPMPRLKQKRYQQHLMAAMTIYVAVMLLVWPLVRTATSVPLKWLAALAPLLPMLYVMALMARRIRDSDELEQRTHLIGLGVATGIVGALSLVGGFLASAQVLTLDGSVLIWVFPLMLASYGITRSIVARRYGGDGGCDPNDSMALHWRLAIGAMLFAFVALFALLKRDAMDAGMLAGMAIGIALAALAKGIIHWRKRQAARQESRNGV
jgi:hypothetical protein